jgi:transposase
MQGHMWEDEKRLRGDRKGLRYRTDLTDQEWKIIEPLIPPPKGQMIRKINIREVTNGLLYILGIPCAWSQIPKDLPARSTLYYYFYLWKRDGTLLRIHDALYGPRESGDTLPSLRSRGFPKHKKV